ncbi:ABC transporter B family member 1 [Spatholobus suberectus]|nr:ABC transporter B family member 1 [Spatholobus suberectus]
MVNVGGQVMVGGEDSDGDSHQGWWVGASVISGSHSSQHVHAKGSGQENIIKLSLDANSEDNISKITTLVQRVYNDENFDLKAWVCVSEEFDITMVATRLFFKQLKHKSFVMHDLMHDLTISVAGEFLDQNNLKNRWYEYEDSSFVTWNKVESSGDHMRQKRQTEEFLQAGMAFLLGVYYSGARRCKRIEPLELPSAGCIVTDEVDGAPDTFSQIYIVTSSLYTLEESHGSLFSTYTFNILCLHSEVVRGLNECIVRLEPDNMRRISASMQNILFGVEQDDEYENDSIDYEDGAARPLKGSLELVTMADVAVGSPDVDHSNIDAATDDESNLNYFDDDLSE